MEARRAKHGRRSGERFWGCPNFFKTPPDKCDGTINIEKDGTWVAPIRRAPTIVSATAPTQTQMKRAARKEYERAENLAKVKAWQRQKGTEESWDDEELDEKLEEWMKEEEGPRVIKPEDELQITYKIKFQTKQESAWMTAMSIKILLGDDDLEVVKIIDRAGKPVKEEELP
jgi:hypothetical protein